MNTGDRLAPSFAGRPCLPAGRRRRLALPTG
jgi:hypothetical protein